VVAWRGARVLGRRERVVSHRNRSITMAPLAAAGHPRVREFRAVRRPMSRRDLRAICTATETNLGGGTLASLAAARGLSGRWGVLGGAQ
jgi:hypothetical protein